MEEVAAAPFADEDMGSRSNKKPSSRALNKTKEKERGLMTQAIRFECNINAQILMQLIPHTVILLSDSHLLIGVTVGAVAVGVTEGGGGLAGGPGRAGGPPPGVGGARLAGATAAAAAAGTLLLAVASCCRERSSFTYVS